MNHTHRVLVAVSVALAAAGCTVESETTSSRTSAVQGPCDKCGENSPIVGRLGIHDLSLRGDANDQGYRLTTTGGAAQIVQGSTSYDLHVVLGYVKGARVGLPHLMHAALVDAVIPIERDGVHYELAVRAVHNRKYAVAPYWQLETYTLGWREIGGEEMNPCGMPDGDPTPPPGDPIDSRAEWHHDEAVVFEGDRYSVADKTASQTADDQWFNIACAGDALAKLLVTRNTIHMQPAGLEHAWEQRQAALKMTVADYCGKGNAFTVEGQRLVWQGGGISYLHPPDVLEARWTERGASCLNAPRMLFPSTPEGPIAFPDIWQAITAVCQPPPCTDLDPLNQNGAYFVSAKPVDL